MNELAQQRYKFFGARTITSTVTLHGKITKIIRNNPAKRQFYDGQDREKYRSRFISAISGLLFLGIERYEKGSGG